MRTLKPDAEKQEVMEIMTSWKKEGLQQGRQEGEVAKARDAIIDVLEARFGSLPPRLATRIRAIADPDRLRELLRAAALTP